MFLELNVIHHLGVHQMNAPSNDKENSKIPFRFLIKKKDLMGRLGMLNTPRGNVTTPTILPVINPSYQLIPSKELKKIGVEIVITNSYIIYSKPDLQERSRSKGVHQLIDWDGPIVTDSGAYQLMVYGSVDVTNEEIITFQQEMGVDAGIPLDLPITIKDNHEVARQKVEETWKRIQNIPKHFVCPVQGGRFLDLVEWSAKKVRNVQCSYYALGSEVSLLINYKFATVMKNILTSKRYLPYDKAIHLFGAGHPIFFAPAVAAGVDLFDSAAYALFAKDDRYLTVHGTYQLDKLDEFPCSCNTCAIHTPRELLSMDKDDRERLLAWHNIVVTMEEMRRIRQAIRTGKLFQLILERAMTHPEVFESVKILMNDQQVIELDPLSKDAQKETPFSRWAPEVRRHRQLLLDRWYIHSPKLAIFPEALQHQLFSVSGTQIAFSSHVFGLIPFELRWTYPLSQWERIDRVDVQDLRNWLLKIQEKFERIILVGEEFSDLKRLELEGAELEIVDSLEILPLKADKNWAMNEIKGILAYQYGIEPPEQLHLKFEFGSTKRIRRFRDKNTGKLLGTIRPQDGYIVPKYPLGVTLYELGTNKYVKISELAAEEVAKKRNVFCKHVTEVGDVLAGDEVIVLNEKGVPIAVGKSSLARSEMLDFKRGEAISVRDAVGKYE